MDAEGASEAKTQVAYLTTFFSAAEAAPFKTIQVYACATVRFGERPTTNDQRLTYDSNSRMD